MTGSSQLVEKPRERFMEAAQREMVDFERKERELIRQHKEERAAELRMPALKKELHS